MIFARNLSLVTLVVLVFTAPVLANEDVHHSLEVRIDPADHRLQVVDSLNFVDAVTADHTGAYRFVLHAGLDPRVVSPGWRLQKMDGPVEAGFFGINATTDTVGENVPLEAFQLVPEDGATGRDSARQRARPRDGTRSPFPGPITRPTSGRSSGCGRRRPWIALPSHSSAWPLA